MNQEASIAQYLPPTEWIAASWAVYAEGLVGVGGDRPYDASAGPGLRFMF